MGYRDYIHMQGSTMKQIYLVLMLYITSYAQQPCPGIPTVNYAGKTYNTVKIGVQCWLKENLDVGTRINMSGNQKNNGTIEKYCYNDDPANCTANGGLYRWNEAMQYVTTEGARGICPTGWHIPKNAEFTTLSTTVGGDGNALKAKGWDATSTNTSGFSALLGGTCYLYGNYGHNTDFWSSTEEDVLWTYFIDQIGRAHV